MRKFLIGAIFIIGASALVTGSSHSPTHSSQKKEATPVVYPSGKANVLQVPMMAMAPEAIQADRYDLEWCTVVNEATAIKSPFKPVLEVAHGPPVT